MASYRQPSQPHKTYVGQYEAKSSTLLECSECEMVLPASGFSKRQRSERQKRRCINCVKEDLGMVTGRPADDDPETSRPVTEIAEELEVWTWGESTLEDTTKEQRQLYRSEDVARDNGPALKWTTLVLKTVLMDEFEWADDGVGELVLDMYAKNPEDANISNHIRPGYQFRFRVRVPSSALSGEVVKALDNIGTLRWASKILYEVFSVIHPHENHIT
ncbi:hypothetical protein HK104_005825 [Borealophlyctis nickersoniae]|nr:hypothetical protein HK104_005825 [Borealophlyctis nickersoniae]